VDYWLVHPYPLCFVGRLTADGYRPTHYGFECHGIVSIVHFEKCFLRILFVLCLYCTFKPWPALICSTYVSWNLIRAWLINTAFLTKLQSVLSKYVQHCSDIRTVCVAEGFIFQATYRSIYTSRLLRVGKRDWVRVKGCAPVWDSKSVLLDFHLWSQCLRLKRTTYLTLQHLVEINFCFSHSQSDHSPPSSVEAKKGWSYTSATP
jgi:hypothetical protein